MTNNITTSQIFKVKLGDSTTTDEIVQALHKEGRYVEGHITQKNFPLKPHAIENVEIEIIDPGSEFSEDEGLEFLEAAGLEYPTYEHALRFAEQHGRTTTDKKPYVFFLHEPWLDLNRNRRTVFIDRDLGSCELSLSRPGTGFSVDCVLAGVRRRK